MDLADNARMLKNCVQKKHLSENMNLTILKNIFFLLTFSLLLIVNAQQDYSHNVVRRGNEVFLRGFKPQTQKGKTCAFYSTSMILAYYGKKVSPDKLKHTGRGNNQYSDRKKSSHFMAERLKNFGFVFIIVQHNNDELFRKIVKYAIDNGIPLRWSCNMRFSPIKKERNNSSHARIITGYVENNEQMSHILYTDSWGSDHINKIMTCKNAMKMTNRYGPVFPQKNNQKIISDFNFLIEKYTKKKNLSNQQIVEDEDE